MINAQTKKNIFDSLHLPSIDQFPNHIPYSSLETTKVVSTQNHRSSEVQTLL